MCKLSFSDDLNNLSKMFRKWINSFKIHLQWPLLEKCEAAVLFRTEGLHRGMGYTDKSQWFLSENCLHFIRFVDYQESPLNTKDLPWCKKIFFTFITSVVISSLFWKSAGTHTVHHGVFANKTWVPFCVTKKSFWESIAYTGCACVTIAAAENGKKFRNQVLLLSPLKQALKQLFCATGYKHVLKLYCQLSSLDFSFHVLFF